MTDARLYSVRLKADVYMPNRDFEYQHRLHVVVSGAVENGLPHIGDALLPSITVKDTEPCPHLTCLLGESANLLAGIPVSKEFLDLVGSGLFR